MIKLCLFHIIDHYLFNTSGLHRSKRTKKIKATENPPLPLLQAYKSTPVKLTVSRALDIKQSEGIPNKMVHSVIK